MLDLVNRLNSEWDRQSIADYAATSVATIERWIRKDPRFPKPINDSPRNPLYRSGDCIQYLQLRKKDPEGTKK